MQTHTEAYIGHQQCPGREQDIIAELWMGEKTTWNVSGVESRILCEYCFVKRSPSSRRAKQAASSHRHLHWPPHTSGVAIVTIIHRRDPIRCEKMSSLHCPSQYRVAAVIRHDVKRRLQLPSIPQLVASPFSSQVSLSIPAYSSSGLCADAGQRSQTLAAPRKSIPVIQPRLLGQLCPDIDTNPGLADTSEGRVSFKPHLHAGSRLLHPSTDARVGGTTPSN